jgi:hypothetical protein
MAKEYSFFELGETPPKKNEPENNLLLIPLSKKKPSKNDTPLEKEIRRFNKLIKDIQKLEEEMSEEKENEEKYERLYQEKVLPEMIKLSKLKFEFAQHIHRLFEQGKYTKSLRQHIIEMILGLLSDVREFVPESRELAAHYTNMQVKLLTKKEREQLGSLMEEDGFAANLDDFDVEKMMEENKERFEQAAFEEHEKHSERQQHQQRQNKKLAAEHPDINSLYRELARLLHPDLEKDENIRHEKEQLMKELSRARLHHDLYAMLVIKAKAARFTAGKEGNKEEAYSLKQMKLYNKELKKKLDDYKANFLFNNMMSGLELTSLGRYISMPKMGMKMINPEKEIEMELKDIKETIKDITHDIKKLKTPDDLKNMAEFSHKNSQKQWDDWDDFF